MKNDLIFEATLNLLTKQYTKIFLFCNIMEKISLLQIIEVTNK